ncbi:hypothetical protein U9M48_041443 [Paspalum notatum var. saurae]|uniref:Uncharacterized protein n=1 Tax=Paspalum notatum var. saurae TaxID=547442 RepID=A0AAQ3XE68_PASNO
MAPRGCQPGLCVPPARSLSLRPKQIGHFREGMLPLVHLESGKCAHGKAVFFGLFPRCSLIDEQLTIALLWGVGFIIDFWFLRSLSFISIHYSQFCSQMLAFFFITIAHIITNSSDHVPAHSTPDSPPARYFQVSLGP